MEIKELKIILDALIELTRLRQNECKHLCVDNFASQMFHDLLKEYNSASKIIKEEAIINIVVNNYKNGGAIAPPKRRKADRRKRAETLYAPDRRKSERRCLILKK